jgi:CheY-like chemotaxis protein
VGIPQAERRVVHHEPMHRVLLADDDRAIRESLKRALQLEGYAVAAAVDDGQVQPRLANWTQLCAAT